MQSTGIIRRIDDLGRIVIPKELRWTLNFEVGDPIEMFVDNSGPLEPMIYMRKYTSPSGKDVFKSLIERLESIKDSGYCESTADIKQTIEFLKENEDKFNFWKNAGVISGAFL